MYKLRRLRLYDAGAPGVLPPIYAVIFIGGALILVLTYFLGLERFQFHVVMTAIVSAMMGLAVFMIVAMDHPFRGGVGISPDAFEQAYAVLMQGNANKGHR